MADKNCSSCDDLRQSAPNLIVNGLTNTECTSLANNTGLSPSSGHNDCTDLNNLNDCLIGNLESEIDAYDVCDWKDFTKNHVNNAWTVFKAIICAVCGLWTNLASLRKKIDDMCKLIESIMSHPVLPYGTMPNGGTAAQKGGVIGTKNGAPIIVPLPRSEVASDAAWAIQNVGFRYGKLEATNCEGVCRRHEWIAPDLYAYKFNTNASPEYGDVIWSIDKASVVGRMGMTNEMWAIREQNPLTWASDWSAGSALIGLRMSVENNRLTIKFAGAIGDGGSALNGKTIIPPADQAERLYRFTCS